MDKDLQLVLYIGLAFFGVLAVGLVFFVVRYTVKQKEHAHAKQLMRESFQKEVARVQTEVAEHTIRMIAHELHDNISQNLLVVLREMEAMENTSPSSEAIHMARSNVGAVMHRVRNLSHELSNHRLEEGLQTAIRNDLNRLSNALNMQTLLLTSMADQSDYARHEEWQTDLILYRCFQELIANILKHAQATSVEVELIGNASRWLTIIVKDNGKGFATDAAAEGIGFKNIRERLALLDGRLHVDSVLNKGTEIKISI